MSNSCFASYDPYKNPCAVCPTRGMCYISTGMKEAVKPKLTEYTYTPIDNGFTVRDADSYSNLQEGDMVALVDELDGVAVVTVLGESEEDEFDVLVRVNDLAKLYKVEQLSGKIDDVKIETVTDRFKKVYVTLEHDGIEVEGIASCNTSDTFNLMNGFKLATLRAQQNLLGAMESKLLSEL